MKLTVVTDRQGNVLATARQVETTEAGAGRLVAGEGQIAHEIETTQEMEKAESAEQLHSIVADSLRGS